MNVLTEMSIVDLKRRTETSFDTKKRHKIVNEVSIRNLTYTQVDDDKIRVDSTSTTGNMSYNTQIVLTGVEIVPRDTPNSLDILHTSNIMPIQDKGECKFRCSCLDYRWTFAHYNNMSKNLHGNPFPPYQATTDRGPRNPLHTPGLCKHLLKLIEVLKSAKVIQ